MAKRKYVEFRSLKPGQCFKIKGSRNIYMADDLQEAQQITGKLKGCVSGDFDGTCPVAPVNVTITEEAV